MPSAPRWVDALQKALSLPANKSQIQYQLATVDANNVPHVRTVGYRKILSPTDAPHLPVILVTTDVRTTKVAHVRANDRVELAWFLAGSHEQFRIAGRVRVVPAPTHPSYNDALADLPLALRTLHAQGFDWEALRAAEFSGMPGTFRINYCRPPAGADISALEGAEWPAALPKVEGEEDEEDKRNWKLGLSNLSLFLIEPVEVEYAAIPGKPTQRTKFVRDESGEWTEKALVP
ncbi:pyridoxamine 5'-phosphate oxidase-domain-containing protein [Amylocystis lapponica]|nr:pyridoxamine 5'-phosphate oxidase-domain-containing protein [Amylocystis lapponica]